MADPQKVYLDEQGNPTAAPKVYLDDQGNALAPTFSAENEKDASGNATVDPNTVGTFLSHAGAQLNPIPAIAGAGNALLHPIDTIKAVGAAQGVPLDKAKAAYAKGDYPTAARHFINYLIPLAGPVLDTASDRMQQGQYAAGAGDAVGLGLSMFGPELLNEGVSAASQSARARQVAESAEAGSVNRFADVMTPKGSSKEIRQLGKQGQTVAGAVREGTTAITPAGLQSQITDRLSQAGDALDAAYQAIPSRVGYSVQPVIKKLQNALDNLTRQGTGGAVISEANADRAAALNKAIEEVKQIGPFTNTEQLAKLRGDWKTLAQNAFVPSVNPNFQQIRGAAKGWADAYSSLQDALVERHPQLRPLNADYHVWKQAADVMQALEDQQRVKPTVGRTIMSRFGGAAAGAAAGGGMGMATGEILGPVIERGISNKLAPAMKLITARRLADMAEAIRAGDAPRAGLILQTLRPLLVANAPQQAGDALPAMIPAQASRSGDRRP